MYKEDLALNNQQRLIWYKTQPNPKKQRFSSTGCYMKVRKPSLLNIYS